MHALLIPLHNRTIPISVSRSVVTDWFAGDKAPLQPVHKSLASHQAYESINILRHKIAELPGITLHILGIGARLEGVEVGRKASKTIPQMSIAVCRIDGIAPPCSPLGESMPEDR